MNKILHEEKGYQLKQLATDHFIIVNTQEEDIDKYIIASYKRESAAANRLYKIIYNK